MELQSSKGCNETEHAKVVRATVLSVRMHETALWQNEQIMSALAALDKKVDDNNSQLHKVSKMSAPESAAQDRRDRPSFLNGGISIKGFKAWGAPARILAFSAAAAIVIVALWWFNRAKPPEFNKVSINRPPQSERITQ